MALDAVESRYRSTLKQVGQATLNALYPKDFEYYVIALELVDSKGRTVDYFAFPVNPDNLEEIARQITNVRKTNAGVNVNKNSSFVPVDITLSGTFGKRFKLLVNSNELQLLGFRLSTENGVYKITKPGEIQRPYRTFASFAKTGYGCVKVLQAIVNKSKELDQYGKPYSLYFYNPILGDNYQVEVMMFKHSQDKDQNNRIPKYQLQMVGVAPLDHLLSDRNNSLSAIRNIGAITLQKAANNLATRVRRSIGV